MHKLLTKKQTAERVGLSMSTIERLMDKKLFPQPVNPNGTERMNKKRGQEPKYIKCMPVTEVNQFVDMGDKEFSIFL